MIEPPVPDDEEKRLALLRACNIIYTPAEKAFDDLARLAADLCGSEIALITLVDSDYQWFKARVGVEQEGLARDLSFCGHCINHRAPMIVEDTHLDERFADNPLVTGEPRIRFYVGVPLLVDACSAVGAISVADRTPRRLTDRQLDGLRRLARQIERELRLRRELGRAEAASSGLDLAEGTLIQGRWRLARPLGRGSVGSVFEAFDRDGARVAVKVLLPEWRANEAVVERFAREARVLMRLQSPHVGRLIDVGNLDAHSGDLPFLVLEYLEGTDLDRLIDERKRVPFGEAFGWCADACDGVAEAHELGVIHRDLKPSNVFLSRRDDEVPVVKVLDFGIAAGDPSAPDRAKLTAVESVVGSPAYMAPEQMLSASDVDPRSDIWSMGALLYHLVTGALPFPGETDLQIFASAMTTDPLPLRDAAASLPKEAEQIVLRCLRRSRGERYASMRELAVELRAASGRGG